MIRRRTILAGLVATSLARGAGASGQSRLPLIGWLDVGSRESSGHLLVALKEGLAELGWREGTQFVMEERWANSRVDRLDPLARELAVRRPDVIVGGPSQTVRALVKAAPTTPIVHATGSDPVGVGFAASLARPGGMVTGLANAMTDLSEKYLEVLLDAVPSLRRVGFLVDSTNINRARIADGIRRSIERSTVTAELAEAGDPADLEPALARLVKARVQGFVIMPSPIFRGERRRPDPEGGQARRPAHGGAHSHRADHQPQDGQDARRHRAAGVSAPRRPRHPVAGARPTRW